MRKQVFLFVYSILTLIGQPCFAQYAQNQKFQGQLRDSKVKLVLNYDLVSSFDNVPCQVKVKFTSGETGERTFYLNEVRGDVGDLVYPGPNKEIVWDYVEELVHFSADVKLDIEVKPSVQVLEKIKRGKQLTVTLAPIYTANKSYAVKLFLGGKEMVRLNDVLLIERSFQVQIPKKSKVKKNYQLAITDGEKTYFSNAFKVKRKFSLGWVIVPVLAVPAYMAIKQYIDDNTPLPGPPGSGYPDGN